MPNTHGKMSATVTIKEKRTPNRMCVCPRHLPPGPEPPFLPLGTSAEAKLSHGDLCLLAILHALAPFRWSPPLVASRAYS